MAMGQGLPGSGMGKLANVIDRRIRRQAEAPPPMDFGTVKKNGSLVTDTFPETVPKGEYSVLEGFRHSGADTRVLVAWVGGSEAVVIGAVARE